MKHAADKCVYYPLEMAIDNYGLQNLQNKTVHQGLILWIGDFLVCMKDKSIQHSFCLAVKMYFNSVDTWTLR